MVAPIIGGIAVGARVLSAAKKVISIRKNMRKIQGKEPTTVKKVVQKSMRRTPEKEAKLGKLAGELRKAVQATGKANSRKVLNKASQLERKTGQGRNVAKNRK